MQHLDGEAYLRFAGDCLRKASHERDPGKRGLFILIATAWAKLADRARAEAPPVVEGRERSQVRTLH